MVVNAEEMSTILKKLAADKNISGKKLAKLVKCTPETVSRHMNGRTQVNRDDADAYAKILEVEPDRFYAEMLGLDKVLSRREKHQDISIRGWIDHKHHVHSWPGLETKIARTTMRLPENLVGFQYPDDASYDDWKKGRIMFVSKLPMEEKKISEGSFRGLCIAKVKNSSDIRMCVLFPNAPPKNYNISLSYTQTYTMLNPYDVTSSKDANPVQIEWASHVIMAVQSLKCCDMKIIVT